ncbi:hypothetical protein [Kutzneria chonburiensis]|uniref:hypothetical protein n=1 Tax=Kutzneria chonburiensis TaxID=1483604 RepID=UPI00235F20E4|nr:hypothetical protein [Kutzneria chonburiensis]
MVVGGGATVVSVVLDVVSVVLVVVTVVGVTVDVSVVNPLPVLVTCGFGSQPDSSAVPSTKAPTTARRRDIRGGLSHSTGWTTA